MDFAAELAKKIGVAPVKQQDSDHDDDDDKEADGEWSDDEHQAPQTAEVQEKQRSETKSRSDTSKSKEKKSHHQHHHHDKKDRSESHGEHKHRKRHNSKTSHTSVDTRKSVPAEEAVFGQSSPQEDGLFGSEGTPFAKKGGLFSGGGNLFDDAEGDKVPKIIYQVLVCEVL